MIHFFPKFTNDATRTPFGQAIAASGVEHRFFASRVSLGYQSRLALILTKWPRMISLALRGAWQSLVKASPHPDAVLLDWHFEVLAFGLLRALLRRPGPAIVMLGFIFTARRNPVLNALRRLYFGLVFRCADVVICHSATEVANYQRIFGGRRARFVFVPYGLHVGGDRSSLSPSGPRPVIVSAGRSGRDYATLLQAVTGLEAELRVVCDSEQALHGLQPAANTTLLRNCYGDAYVRELRAADVVVVPLAVDDISAGQMVVMQAMAFGKPVIVTRTVTILEYLRDGEDALLVPPGDAEALRQAIRQVIDTPAEAQALGQRALASFERSYAMPAFVGHLLRVIRDAMALPPGDRRGTAP